MNEDEKAVAACLKAYEAALNASSTDMVMPLYAPDAVFMPQNAGSSVGSDAIRAAYDAIFRTIRLEVTFDVLEAVRVSDDWAFASTTSAGTQTTLATGAKEHEGNHELFVFRRVSGAWKIARYCFSTTNPPAA